MTVSGGAGAQLEQPDATWRAALRRSMLAWYATHARDLPWRRTQDPYAVWVSEIMLQQTQVETVKPYFERFLKRFPTVQSLAVADEQDVLRLWEGLGYYRRARQMHQAARQVEAEHDGKFPAAPDAVLGLPGIGRYTSGAILSIAFDQRQPILEGNTLRLYSRLLGFHGDPRSASGQRLLWDFAERILPRKNVGRFNQAMMELGSAVCRPRNPLCDECPVARLCQARAFGWQHRIPARSKKTQYEDIAETAVLVRRQERVLLRRCGAQERWSGLWDFPRFPTPNREQVDALIAGVEQLTGVRVTMGRRVTTLKHVVTRFRISLTCHDAMYASGRVSDCQNCRWVTVDELADFPLSVTGRKLSGWLDPR